MDLAKKFRMPGVCSHQSRDLRDKVRKVLRDPVASVSLLSLWTHREVLVVSLVFLLLRRMGTMWVNMKHIFSQFSVSFKRKLTTMPFMIVLKYEIPRGIFNKICVRCTQ